MSCASLSTKPRPDKNDTDQHSHGKSYIKTTHHSNNRDPLVLLPPRVFQVWENLVPSLLQWISGDTVSSERVVNNASPSNDCGLHDSTPSRHMIHETSSGKREVSISVFLLFHASG